MYKALAALLCLTVVSVVVAVDNGCGCSPDPVGQTCSGGPTPGARALAAELKRSYGSRQEIYNCRTMAGRPKLSLHGEGRAVDHYVRGAAGTAIFDDLIATACQRGIQEVIFNRQIWTKAGGVQPYTGVHPHDDHVHVGLNRCGARGWHRSFQVSFSFYFPFYKQYLFLKILDLS